MGLDLRCCACDGETRSRKFCPNMEIFEGLNLAFQSTYINIEIFWSKIK